MIRIGNGEYAILRDNMSVAEFRAAMKSSVNGIQMDYPDDSTTFVVPFSYYSCAKQIFQGIILGNGRVPKMYIFKDKKICATALSSSDDKPEQSE